MGLVQARNQGDISIFATPLTLVVSETRAAVRGNVHFVALRIK